MGVMHCWQFETFNSNIKERSVKHALLLFLDVTLH